MKENKNLPIEEESIQTYTQETSPNTTDPAVAPEPPKPKKSILFAMSSLQ